MEKDTIEQLLHEQKIAFERVDHPIVYTTKEANRYIENIPGTRTKTLFLTNKKKNQFYLVILNDQKRLDRHRFETIVDQKRIQFASDTLLEAKLGVVPGTVSLFSLLNNHEHDVQVFLDSSILENSRICFHPNDSSRTLFFATDAVFTLLDEWQFPYHIVKL